MNKDEDRQIKMQDVKNWFENTLQLGRGFSVHDVHTSTQNEVTLEKAHTRLCCSCGFDIVIKQDVSTQK